MRLEIPNNVGVIEIICLKTLKKGLLMNLCFDSLIFNIFKALYK